MTEYSSNLVQSVSGMRDRQHGFTLIELMISMVLGIVIMAATLLTYSSGSTATRNAQAQGQMNEDGQMALTVVTQELRRAGYNPARATGAATTAKNDLLQANWGIFACDTDFVDITAPLVSNLACGGAGQASLAVVAEGDLVSGRNTIGPPALPMDCNGRGVAASITPPVAGPAFYVMQSRLYIANNALRCRGGDDLTQTEVLAENIESMAFMFGIAEPGVLNSKRVVGYLTAAQVTNDAGFIASLPAAVDRWNKVVAVRVCVVVMSEGVILRDLETAATYTDCAGNNVAIADGRLRRAYRTTVLLRNHGVGYDD